MSDNTDAKKHSVHTAYTAYWVVGAVAAAVSAATVAYVFYWRARHLQPQVEGVQQLLDRCHEQVQNIEDKLAQLNELTSLKPS